VDLNGSLPDGNLGNASGSLSQNVRTTPGHKYLLTWFMAGNPSQGCGPVTKVLHVFWGGKIKESLTFNVSNDSDTSMGWVARRWWSWRPLGHQWSSSPTRPRLATVEQPSTTFP